MNKIEEKKIKFKKEEKKIYVKWVHSVNKNKTIHSHRERKKNNKLLNFANKVDVYLSKLQQQMQCAVYTSLCSHWFEKFRSRSHIHLDFLTFFLAHRYTVRAFFVSLNECCDRTWGPLCSYLLICNCFIMRPRGEELVWVCEWFENVNYLLFL